MSEAATQIDIDQFRRAEACATLATDIDRIVLAAQTSGVTNEDIVLTLRTLTRELEEVNKDK